MPESESNYDFLINVGSNIDSVMRQIQAAIDKAKQLEAMTSYRAATGRNTGADPFFSAGGGRPGAFSSSSIPFAGASSSTINSLNGGVLNRISLNTQKSAELLVQILAALRGATPTQAVTAAQKVSYAPNATTTVGEINGLAGVGNGTPLVRSARMSKVMAVEEDTKEIETMFGQLNRQGKAINQWEISALDKAALMRKGNSILLENRQLGLQQQSFMGVTNRQGGIITPGEIAAGQRAEQERRGQSIMLEKGLSSQVGGGGKGFLETIEATAKRAASWALVGGAIYGAQAALVSFAEEATKIDDITRKIQNNTNTGFGFGSRNGAEGIVAGALNTAQKLGGDAKETLDAMADLSGKFKDPKDRQAMLEYSMMLSNVFGGGIKDKVDILRATMNQFGMQMKDIGKISDMLTASANLTGESIESFAAGLEGSSAAAKEAGLNFSQYLGVVSTISNITGSAGTASQFFNSIVKNAGSLTNANKVFKDSGGTLSSYDSRGQIRPLMDFLGDIAKQWKTLTATQRESVSADIAGPRKQADVFKALMENFSQVAENTTANINSLGLTTRENKVAVDGVSGAMKRLMTDIEKFANSQGVINAERALLRFAEALVKVGDFLFNFGQNDYGKNAVKNGFISEEYYRKWMQNGQNGEIEGTSPGSGESEEVKGMRRRIAELQQDSLTRPYMKDVNEKNIKFFQDKLNTAIGSGSYIEPGKGGTKGAPPPSPKKSNEFNLRGQSVDRIDLDLNKTLIENTRNYNMFGEEIKYVENAVTAYRKAITELMNDSKKAGDSQEELAIKTKRYETQIEIIAMKKTEKENIRNKIDALGASNIVERKNLEIALAASEKKIEAKEEEKNSIKDITSVEQKYIDTLKEEYDYLSNIKDLQDTFRAPLQGIMTSALPMNQEFTAGSSQFQADKDYLNRRLAQAQQVQSQQGTLGTPQGRNELMHIREQMALLDRQQQNLIDKTNIWNNALRSVGDTLISKVSGKITNSLVEGFGAAASGDLSKFNPFSGEGNPVTNLLGGGGKSVEEKQLEVLKSIDRGVHKVPGTALGETVLGPTSPKSTPELTLMNKAITVLGSALAGAGLGASITAGENKRGFGGAIGGAVGGGLGSALGMAFGGPAGAGIGGTIGSLAGGLFGAAFDKTIDPLTKQLDDLSQSVQHLDITVQTNTKTISDTMASVLNAPSNFVMPIPQGIQNGSVSAQSALVPMQAGGIITSSGPAYLHAGERVVPAGQMGTGSVTHHNEITINGANKDPQQIAIEVLSQINRAYFSSSQLAGNVPRRY